ncbi:M16 family metallopeptidase [Micromonospora sp. DT231]|uniref:M16 family metallopeptidase n=1 Tax=Micromonospora sp. DT231 TaxID=3416526 RepID=UPI003CFB6DB6
MVEESELAATIRETTLPGGLRVITETVPSMSSVALGAFVDAGSCDEPAALGGLSHFLEHLLFKGTQRRGALEVARTIDAVGGDSNAQASKELTFFHVRVRDTELPLAVDLLLDLLTCPRLDADDVEAERRVILGELAMQEDDPGNVVRTLLGRTLFGDGSLARPAVGTRESVLAIDADDVRDFYHRHYRPDRVLIAAAGNVRHDELVELVAAAVARAGWQGTAGGADAAAVDARMRDGGPRVRVLQRPWEQAHVTLGVRGLGHTDPRRYAMTVLGTAFGGGLSSRLFQEVREKRGLAYAVGSYAMSYRETGTFVLFAGCAPAKVDDLLACLGEQVVDLRARGLTDDELDRGKRQLAGKFVLGQEDTYSRMTRIASSRLFTGVAESVSDVLDGIAAVRAEDVDAVAAELWDVGRSRFAVAGPMDPDHDFAAVLP